MHTHVRALTLIHRMSLVYLSSGHCAIAHAPRADHSVSVMRNILALIHVFYHKVNGAPTMSNSLTHVIHSPTHTCIHSLSHSVTHASTRSLTHLSNQLSIDHPPHQYITWFCTTDLARRLRVKNTRRILGSLHLPPDWMINTLNTYNM